MSKRLILHIGAEKTATTTIQKCLSNNRDILRKGDIYYPKTSFSNDAQFSLVAALHELDHGKRLEFAPPGEYTYESEWKPVIDKFKALDDGAIMILSAEHFSSRLKNKGLERLAQIVSYFNADEVEIVYYFRRQDLYFQSWYSTYIKAGGKKKIEEVYPDLIKDRWFFDFGFVKSKWSEHLPYAKISLLPFDIIKEKVPIVEHFIRNFICEDLSGFDLKVPSSERNLSWSSTMIGLGRCFNNMYGSDFPKRYQLLECFNKYAIKGKISQYIISEKVSREILNQYKESNEKLCDEIDIEYKEVFKDLSYDDYENPDEVNFTKEALLDFLVSNPVWKMK